MSFDETSLDVFHRRLSPISCEVVVRWRAAGDDGSLAGTLRGPECATSRMLPATFTLRSTPASGDEACAAATIPDPCFWSPALPAFFRAAIDVLRGGEKIARVERRLGLRPLDIRGDSFYWESRRWVPRTICFESLAAFDWDGFRETGAALSIENPDDDFCRRASEEGLLLLARVRGDDAELQKQARRLARWSAVAMVLIEGDRGASADVLEAAPNLIFLQPGGGEGAGPRIAFVQELSHEAPAVLRRPSIPAIAVRRLATPTDAASARAAIDRLQRDLAPGDWAGYIV